MEINMKKSIIVLIVEIFFAGISVGNGIFNKSGNCLSVGIALFLIMSVLCFVAFLLAKNESTHSKKLGMDVRPQDF